MSIFFTIQAIVSLINTQIYSLRKTFLILLILLAVTGLMTIGCAQSNNPGSEGQIEAPFPYKESQEEALKSLETFKRLVTKQNYKQMGFESVDEVTIAILGDPILDFMVRLDNLKKYQRNIDPNEMLSTTNLVVYPVLVNGEVRSSIEIVYKEEKFQTASFGSPNFIKLCTSHQIELSKVLNLPRTSFFIVRVPAFNIVFLGHRANEKLLLTPLMDMPVFKFNAGESISADDVFTRLAPAAMEFEDLPG